MSPPELWAAEVSTTGENGRSKLTLQFVGKPDPNQEAALKAEATAIHRRHYQEWCKDPVLKVWLIHTSTA